MRSLRRCSHAPNISPATYTATRISASCAVHKYRVGPQSLLSACFMVLVNRVGVVRSTDARRAGCSLVRSGESRALYRACGLMGCWANQRCGLIQALLRSGFTASCALFGRRLSFASGPLPSCGHYALSAVHGQPRRVAFRHTASLPTASSTGTRSTGIDFPHPRDQPITATCTGSSTVYQTWPQPGHRRCRVIRSDSLPLVHSALISSPPHRGHSIGNLHKYTTTMAP